MSPTVALILVLIGLVGSSYYSGLETGIFSINRLRLRHLVRKQTPGAAILDDFLQKPDRLLGTTLIGNNLSNVTLSIAAAALGSTLGGLPGNVCAFLLTTVVMLVLGEYLPKFWFRCRPAARTLPFMQSFRISGIVFYPLAVVVTAITRVLIPVRDPSTDEKRPFITVDEIRHLTHVGEKAGTFSTDERRMIERVLDLTHTPCRTIMDPRESIVQIEAETEVEDILQLARNRDLSFFPVWQNETGRYIGIISIFDLLVAEDLDGKRAEDLMRPPQFVSAETPCDTVLERLRMSRLPLTLVTGESAEVVGMISSEHLLEQIVGKLQGRGKKTPAPHQN